MSAWLCSDLHTKVLASWAVKKGLAPDFIAVAIQFRSANNDALRALYRSEPEPLSTGLGEVDVSAYTDHQINTLARCFEYQCSEGSVMDGHPAASLIKALIEKSGGTFPLLLPTYWGI